MNKINVLDAHTADLIAAGEVVERPGSVCKELVENAIDAGATAVTVEIKGGGITYLRVTDDGSGIGKEDVPLAFLRHSTSKIKVAGDLDKIKTLGFRGEALAAISSVSKLTIRTKTRDAEEGTVAYLVAGEIREISEAPMVDGTTMVIENLFYNTPARMKFLKKDNIEAGFIEAILTAEALINPNISFKLIVDGKEKLYTAGNNDELFCIYQLFGKETADNLLKIEYPYEYVKVTGFTSKPLFARGNRSMQFFYVNGRAVKSKSLQVALEVGYGERLMKGKFPICVLNIELPFEEVDVNVHPAKTEVKFAREKLIFDAIVGAVRVSLSDDIPDKMFEKRIEPIAEKRIEEIPSFTFKPEPQLPPMPTSVIEEIEPQQTSFEDEKMVFNRFVEAAPVQKTVFTSTTPSYAYLGEVLGTYILIEYDDCLLMIDKHAAHEAMIYAKIKGTIEVSVQGLLQPITVELLKNEYHAILDNIDEISAAGFELEPFSDNSFVIRAIPTVIEPQDVKGIFEKMADALSSSRSADYLEGKLRAIAGSVSCKAAIKGNSRTDELSNRRIVETLLGNPEIRHCPHGRPVIVTFDKYKLEKEFKRKL